MKLKKLLNLKKRNRREPRANAFTVESLEPRLLLSATPMTAAVVTTDHQDYAPGETAVITSSNQAGDGAQFAAGEMVSFQVTRTDGMADYSGSTAGVGPTGNEAWYVVDGMGGFTAHLGSDVSGDGVADWIAPDNDLMANSSISTTWYVEEQYRNSSLLVTAAGQESGAMASHAFTDAAINTSTVVSVSSATSTYGDDVTFTATVTAAAGSIGPVGTVTFFDALNNDLGSTSSAVSGGGLNSIFSITLSEATLSQLAAGSYVVHAVFAGGIAGADSYNDSTSGTVNHTVGQKHITGSFGADSRAYDGTTDAFVLFTDLNGHIASDEVALASGVATFAEANAGFSKTVAMTGATLFGADAGNYILDSVANTTADIDKAEAIITVTDFVGAFDGNPHVATGEARGVLGELLAGLDMGESFTDVPGGTASWSFLDVTGNYNNQFGTAEIVITAEPVNTSTTIAASIAGSTIAASTYGDTVTLTATVTAATGSIAPAGTVEFFDGVGNSLGLGNFAGSVGLDSTFTFDVATLTVGLHDAIHAVFTGNTAFITSTSGNTTVDVSKASVIVTGFSGTYDGLAHGAIATGIFGEDLSAGLTSGTVTDVIDSGLVSWNYTDSTGNYLDRSGFALVTILQKELTGSFTADNKVYDGTTAATGVNATLLGVIGLDDVTVTGGTATFNDANAGINKTVTLNGAILGGADAGNYTLSPGAITTTASITAKAITGSFTADNKAYDGTTVATVGETFLAGLIGADDVTLTGGSADFDDKNVGTGKTVTLTGAILTGAAAGNYTVTSVDTATADITALEITGNFTAANKIYDGNAVAGVSTRTLTGAILGDDVSLTGGTAAFDDANVGTGKTVTLTGATLGGADLANYSLSPAAITTTANIVAKEVTGSFTADNKVYDGTTGAIVSGTSLTGVLAGDVAFVQLTGGTATFADKNVGPGKTVTLTGAILDGVAAGNYSLGTVATTTADITALGITGSFTALNKEYDGSTLAGVFETSLAGDILGDDVILTFDQADFDDKNVGTGKTVTLLNAGLGGVDAGNYSLLSTDITAQADITALQLTFTFTVDGKVYDGTTTATGLIGNLTGFVGTDDVDWDFGAVAFNSAIAGLRGVTLTGLTLIGLDAGNYSLASSTATSTATITQKELTVSFTVNNKVYDGSRSVTGLATTLTGVIAPDDATLAFSSVLFNSPTVGIGKIVTMTGATLTGTEATNYSLASSTITTTANITQKQLTASFTVNNKVYDGTTSVTGLSTTLTGVIAPDNVSLTGGVASFDNANAGNGKTVTLTGLSLAGTEATNYTLASSTITTTANITKANATINVLGYSGVYDGAAHGATGSATGIGGVDLSAGLNLGASFTNALGGTANWTFSGGTNYNDANGSVAITIAKATVTITGDGLNGSGYYGTYDGQAHAATATVRGLGGVVLGQLTSSTTHTNVGIYSDTVTYTDGTGNYNNASKVVKSYILKATVTITGDGLNGSGYYGTYDGQAHAATATVMGVGGVVLGQVTSSTTHTNVGVYSDTVTYTDGTGNYKNASKVVKSYVLKASVTITGDGLNGSGYYGTYDGAAHAATATVTGVGGVVLGQVTSSTTHTNAGVYSDTVTYTDGTGNYKNASKVVKSYILKATVTITGDGLNGSGYFGTFDGQAHAATGTVTGVGGVVLGQVTSSTTHTNVGIYSDTVTFLGDANYKAASKVVKSYIIAA